MNIQALVSNEQARREAFPVCKQSVFLAHAGVTALPKAVADAVVDYTRRSSEHHQEFGEVLRDIVQTRRVAANFIGAEPEEIALLGPTSLGLSLFANGIEWQAGDEVLCYADDYPANVYPWIELRRKGVEVRYLRPERPGELTVGLVEQALTPRTRMVALASCNFLTGYRIDVDAIGALLGSRGVLFSLDAIQTLGAFPLSVKHVDFLSADAHKWLLGPLAIGIVFVKRKHFELLRPTLLGAWNVISPNFIARDEIAFPDTAQRYEPGVLNVAGIYGMRAAMEMLGGIGLENVAGRLLALKERLTTGLLESGFEVIGPVAGPQASGITTFRHSKLEMAGLFKRLERERIVASLRHDRAGGVFIRVSPHFYNTFDEMDHLVSICKQPL